jgi:hypothetical protein
MRTPKSPAVPQRKERNAFQAGCREFESRPPLQERRVTAPKTKMLKLRLALRLLELITG